MTGRTESEITSAIIVSTNGTHQLLLNRIAVTICPINLPYKIYRLIITLGLYSHIISTLMPKKAFDRHHILHGGYVFLTSEALCGRIQTEKG